MQRHELIDNDNYAISRFGKSDAEREPQLEELLTIEDLSILLKVPKSWIYEHTRKRGREKLPYVKLGKYLRFEAKAVPGQTHLKLLRLL